MGSTNERTAQAAEETSKLRIWYQGSRADIFYIKGKCDSLYISVWGAFRYLKVYYFGANTISLFMK